MFHVIFTTGDEIEKKLDRIIGLLTVVKLEGNLTMATVQQLKDDVDALKTGVTQLVGVINDLKGQLASIPGRSAEEQAVIDAAFAEAEDAKAAIVAALTPPATDPVPPAAA